MDLNEYQSVVTGMTPAERQKARADLLHSLRVAYRSTTLWYDDDEIANVQDLEVKLHVVQTEINLRG